MRAIALAAVGLSFLCSAQSRAQMLEVAPVSIVFPPEQRTASLTITNRGAAATMIQVRPFLWRETDDASTLTDTTALAASPPFAEISPRSIAIHPASTARAAWVDRGDLPLADRSAPAPRTRRASTSRLPPVAAGFRATEQPSCRRTGLECRPGPVGRRTRRAQSRQRHATIVSAQLSAPNGATVPGSHLGPPLRPPGVGGALTIGNVRLPNTGSVRLRITSDTGVQEATASIVSAPP